MEHVMNSSQKSWTQVLFILSLSLAACTPVAEPSPGSISGGIYFDCDKSGKLEGADSGISDMVVRLYHGQCGENLIQTHNTDENGEFMFSGLEPGEYCVFPDFELKTCGYAGNAPTTPVSRHVTLEDGMRVDLVWFGFGDLSGDTGP
jgi:hypothetical protein